jgi:hypothetical protein
MIKRKLVLAGALLPVVLPPVVARGELKWEAVTAVICVPAGSGQSETKFAFQNVGRGEVRITSVTASCGCTTPVPGKDTYGPGERGAIKVSYQHGAGSGEKSILVSTTDPEQPRVILKLQVQEVLATQSAREVVRWEVGERLLGKRHTLRVAGRVIAVRPTDPGFHYELHETPDPGVYDLMITPDQTTHEATVRFDLTTDPPAAAHATPRIYARVGPKVE